MVGNSVTRKNQVDLKIGKYMSNLTRWETRWNPFREMEDLQSRIFGLLHRNYGKQPLRGEGETEETMAVCQWAPLVDVAEDEKGYSIKAELPEVKKEDVHVTVENGVLTINGERKFETEEKGRRYHRVERAYGSFTRSFTMPEDAESEHVTADFRDGILNVRITKSEKARPKSIEVKVG
jgi:HSP20 family protein